LHWHNIKRWKQLGANGVMAAKQQGIERVHRLEELLGPLIAIYYNCKRSFGHLPEQDAINCFGRGSESGEGEVAAGRQASQQILKSRVTAQAEEQVTDGRLDQEYRPLIWFQRTRHGSRNP